jgi:signal transduction histidine kinase
MDKEQLQQEIEQLRRSNVELTFLRDLAQATSLSTHFDELIKTIVSKSIRAVGAEQGAIILLEEDTGEGKTLARSMATSGVTVALGLDQMLVGWMGVHKEPLNLADPMNDQRFQAAGWHEAVRSLACVPLLVQSDLIGTLALFNKKGADVFTDDDMRLLTIIAGQSAQMVENARLTGVEQLHEMLKLTQSQLIQSKKMASLGALVAGLLHELNNPLGAIRSSGDVTEKCVFKIVEVMESDIDPEEKTEKAKRYLQTLGQVNDVVKKAGDRVTKVFSSLKSFAGLDESELQSIDIHVQVDNTLTLMEHNIDERIEIVRDFGDIPQVQCHPGEIAQVLMHLLTNSREAIDAHGTITIRTRREDDDVSIQIIDTGRGIPENRMRYLFDPTFNKSGATVKAGLGLFISSNIVHKHQGQIKADSKVGHGTTMTVKLPIAGPSE